MAFDLCAMLKDVSDLGTGREQIEYIRLDIIDEDPNNFYQLTGIEELAANIELCGLQQPIRVRPIPGQSERYMIVSGHRRRAALSLLAKDNPERWSEAPCIVEDDVVSPALQQLRLIYANSNTRTMTAAEISEQAVQVEKLLYQLKEEGYEFPGRMRDHVAQAVGASKSKLARLKVIRDGLDAVWQPAFQRGEIGESVAYALARMSFCHQGSVYAVHGSKAKSLTEEALQIYEQRMRDIDTLSCKHNTVLCDTITGEKDEDGNAVTVRERSVWYLSEDGNISREVPARRAVGEWKTIQVKGAENVETKVIEAFAKNKTSHKMEFWSELDLGVLDNCTFLVYGSLLQSHISCKRKINNDNRYYYKSGELATTATEKLRGVIK